MMDYEKLAGQLHASVDLEYDNIEKSKAAIKDLNSKITLVEHILHLETKNEKLKELGDEVKRLRKSVKRGIKRCDISELDKGITYNYVLASINNDPHFTLIFSMRWEPETQVWVETNMNGGVVVSREPKEYVNILLADGAIRAAMIQYKKND